MKPFTITLKDPDACAGLSDKQRLATSPWVEYGEYVTLEFDPDAKTVRVVPLIASVWLYPNGMVAVTNEQGQQMPSYQGRFEEVRERIERDAPATAHWHGWPER